MSKQSTLDTANTLAINGGPVSSERIFSSWPYYDNKEQQAIQSVLQSGNVNYWTGEQGKLFEKEFAEYLGVKYAVALMNGTAALEAALHALGIGEGDDVIVPCRTFIATASSVVAMKARPVVADIDEVTQNITVENIQAVMTQHTRAIIVVHLAGLSCDMENIMQFAKSHDLKVIEDCAQATGASFNNRHVGTYGDAAAFSFCQDKIMSTGGEGGMLVTNDHATWEKVWSYKDHGKDYETVHQKNNDGGFRWLHHSFGTNLRMTEMQAAIGRIQLTKLPEWVMKRKQNAQLIYDQLNEIMAISLIDPGDFPGHAFYKYYAFVDVVQFNPGWDLLRLRLSIQAEGVPCYYGSCSEIYLEKAFEMNHLRPEQRFPVASKLSQSSLQFPVHPTLNKDEIIEMCLAVKKVIKVAMKDSQHA